MISSVKFVNQSVGLLLINRSGLQNSDGVKCKTVYNKSATLAGTNHFNRLKAPILTLFLLHKSSCYDVN